MPRTVESEVYQFSELSDRAKERARDWWRSCTESDDYSEFVIDDATAIAEILGITFDQKPVKLMSGATRYAPIIYWTGFSSQGDGACFEGRYAYAKDAPKKIRVHAPEDAVLHSIADNLRDIQRKHFYRLEARVTHSGHYYHEYCTHIEVTDTLTGNYTNAEAAEAIVTELRDFMNWIYRQLEKEYEYQNSDEYIDEAMLANEYEFTAEGKRA